MTDVSAWNVVAASNTASPPHGAPEGMSPGALNDTIREVMAAIARFYQTFSGVATTGTANARILALSETLNGYVVGRPFVFKSHIANTGSVTLNVNSQGAKVLKTIQGNNLSSGDLGANTGHIAYYDGTDIIVLGVDESLTRVTETERDNGTVTAVRDFSPSDIHDMIDTHAPAQADAPSAATEDAAGIAELATDGEVDTGTDDSRIVTPAGVRRATGPQVTSDERTAGTESAVRRFSPADVKSMAETHAPDAVTLPTRVSSGEITAGSGTTVRGFAPQDVHNMIDTHVPFGRLLFSGNVQVTAATTWATDANTPDWDIPATGFGLVWAADVVLLQGPVSGTFRANAPAYLVNFATLRAKTAGSYGASIPGTSHAVTLPYLTYGPASSIRGHLLFLGRTSTNKLLVGGTDSSLDPTPLRIYGA